MILNMILRHSTNLCCSNWMFRNVTTFKILYYTLLS